MDSMPSETSPLIPSSSAPSKPQRTVTFDPQVRSSSPQSTQTGKKQQINPPPAALAQPRAPTPVLASINSKLRRRHSQGAPSQPPTVPLPKIGPQRTTKTAQKLKLLPDPQAEEDLDEESGRDVYVQYTRIKDPTARRDAARLGKQDRERLPRVTAYCTAQQYKMDDAMRYLKGKAKLRGANPKQFDECIYSPYTYTSGIARSIEYQASGLPFADSPPPRLSREGRRYSDSAVEVEGESHRRTEDLIDVHTDSAGDVTLETGESALVIPTHGPEDEHYLSARRDSVDFDTAVATPEIFLFAYGTVVMWGLTVKEEQRFLKELAKFETDKLAKDDVQSEEFNFYYTREYQARIYNDFISLRDKKNYMVKLAISHALAQSVKVRHPLVATPHDKRQLTLHRHLYTKTWSTTPSRRPRTFHRKSPRLAKSISRAKRSTSR